MFLFLCKILKKYIDIFRFILHNNLHLVYYY